MTNRSARIWEVKSTEPDENGYNDNPGDKVFNHRINRGPVINAVQNDPDDDKYGENVKEGHINLS